MVGGYSVVVKPRGGIRGLMKLGSIVDVYVPCSKYEDIGLEVETYGLDVATGMKFAVRTKFLVSFLIYWMLLL